MIGYLFIMYNDYSKQKKKNNKELSLFGIPVLSVLIDILLLKKFNMNLFVGSQLMSYIWFFLNGAGMMIMTIIGGA